MVDACVSYFYRFAERHIDGETSAVSSAAAFFAAALSTSWAETILDHEGGRCGAPVSGLGLGLGLGSGFGKGLGLGLGLGFGFGKGLGSANL